MPWKHFLASDGAVDEYLADQLLLPLAFANGPSQFRTARVTLHLLTNAEILQAFLPIRVQIDGSGRSARHRDGFTLKKSDLALDDLPGTGYIMSLKLPS